MEKQPRIVFLSLTNDVGTDRIVSRMGRDGAECAVVGSAECFAAKSRFVRRHVRLPPVGGPWVAALATRRQLDRLVAAWHPDWLIPLDDMAAQLVRSLALDLSTSLGLRALLVRSLGAPEQYATACNRESLMELADEIGIRTPPHRRAPSIAAALEAAVECGYPVVLKREQTCGGFGVAVVQGPDSLRQAFWRGRIKCLSKRPLQRLAGFRQADAAMSLQKFLPGKLAMRTVACREGQVLEGVSFVAERLHPPQVGASTVVRHLASGEMDVAARHLVARLGCSGIVSFDFILDEQGSAHLIEMNARPIGSGHLGEFFGHDIYGALLTEIGEQAPKRRPARLLPPSQAIALFPKELNRDPSGAGLVPSVVHDVPWEEPDILRAYFHRLASDHPDHERSIAGLLWEGGEVPDQPSAESLFRNGKHSGLIA